MIQAKSTHRRWVVAAVMLSMFMVAIEATIVSTAMPQIVGQLGGLTLYSWVFSAFLLTQTAATVIFGKLSDIFGRKPTMLIGIAIFLAGSIACGFAWSMLSLILFRLLQGVGAGAITPVAQTIIGDLYSAGERGRVQAALSSVWASSALLGPLVGAVIIEHVSWAWIFWINIPFGVCAAATFITFLHEGKREGTRRIDTPGAVLFTICIGALMITLTESSGAGPLFLASAGTVFVVSAALLLWQETRALEPLIALDVWGRRPIATANATALLAGMALIGLTTFLPMFVQGVLRQPPVLAGLALTAVMFGWPCGAILAARGFRVWGLRRTLIAGGLLLPLGAAAFLVLKSGTSPLVAGAGSFIMGVGMGLLSAASIVMIQEITAWSQRGSATASNVFSRNLGSTLGAAIYGAVLNHGLANAAGPISSDDLQRVLSGANADAGVEPVRALLQTALHQTFLAVFVTAAAAFCIALAVPHVALGRAEDTAGR